MSKHTPGKWVAEFDGEHWNVVVEGGEGFGRDIVGCEGLFRCDGSDQANAYLIAAAPELLVAGRMLIDSIEGRGTTPEEAITAIRAAVAKATGE